MIFAVANRLGKFACEVEEGITLRELIEWGAFFKLEKEANDRARREAEAKSPKGRRR